MEGAPMKLQVTATEAHQGKALEVDYDQETITLMGAKGELVGTVTWSSIIDYIESADEESRHVRAHPRAPLAIKVRYSTQDGKQFESITGGIGGGGLFIESDPLASGLRSDSGFFAARPSTGADESEGQGGLDPQEA